MCGAPEPPDIQDLRKGTSLRLIEPILNVMRWEEIRKLPLDFCGDLILPFLALKDLIRWDEALGKHETKAVLASIISFTGPFHLSSGFYFRPLHAFKWFWRRQIVVADVHLPTFDFWSWKEILCCVEENLNFIVKIHLDTHMTHMDQKVLTMSDISCCMQNTAFMKKVETLRTTVTKQKLSIYQLFRKTAHLRTFRCDLSGPMLPEIVTMFESCTHLSDVTIGGGRWFSKKFCYALAGRWASLTSLSLSVKHLYKEHLSILGAQWGPLRKLTLTSSSRHTDTDLLTVLRDLLLHCPRLEDVTLHGQQLHDVISVVAENCPALRKADLDCRTLITGFVLAALHAHCPSLHVLSGSRHYPRHRAQLLCTATDVESYAAVFQRMREIDLCSPRIGGWDVPALQAVARNLCNVHTLRLSGNGVDWIVVSALADACRLLVTLWMRCKSQAETTEALATLVRNNRHLKFLSVTGAPVLSDVLLVALGESCPDLHSLSARTQSGALHDHAVMALAQGCCKLRAINKIAGDVITDAAIHALADHCPKLTHVLNLSACPSLTNAGLAYVMMRCKNMMQIQASAGRDHEQIEQAFADLGILVTCSAWYTNRIDINRPWDDESDLPFKAAAMAAQEGAASTTVDDADHLPAVQEDAEAQSEEASDNDVPVPAHGFNAASTDPNAGVVLTADDPDQAEEAEFLMNQMTEEEEEKEEEEEFWEQAPWALGNEADWSENEFTSLADTFDQLY